MLLQMGRTPAARLIVGIQIQRPGQCGSWSGRPGAEGVSDEIEAWPGPRGTCPSISIQDRCGGHARVYIHWGGGARTRWNASGFGMFMFGLIRPAESVGRGACDWPESHTALLCSICSIPLTARAGLVPARPQGGWHTGTVLPPSLAQSATSYICRVHARSVRFLSAEESRRGQWSKEVKIHSYIRILLPAGPSQARIPRIIMCLPIVPLSLNLHVLSLPHTTHHTPPTHIRTLAEGPRSCSRFPRRVGFLKRLKSQAKGGLWERQGCPRSLETPVKLHLEANSRPLPPELPSSHFIFHGITPIAPLCSAHKPTPLVSFLCFHCLCPSLGVLPALHALLALPWPPTWHPKPPPSCGMLSRSPRLFLANGSSSMPSAKPRPRHPGG